MNITKFLIYAIPFFIIAIIHIYACNKDKDRLQHKTKIFLMPLLILTVILYTIFKLHSFTLEIFLLIDALFFGWIGDIFLLEKNLSQKKFKKGLVCFLSGHILYIIILFRIYDFSYTSYIPTILIFLLYSIVIFFIFSKSFFPKGVIRYLIIIYAIILCLNSCTSLILIVTYFTKKNSFNLYKNYSYIFKLFTLFGGGLLFAISDTMLSFITFNRRFKHADTLVMTTYTLAQFLLALGITLW